MMNGAACGRDARLELVPLAASREIGCPRRPQAARRDDSERTPRRHRCAPASAAERLHLNLSGATITRSTSRRRVRPSPGASAADNQARRCPRITRFAEGEIGRAKTRGRKRLMPSARIAAGGFRSGERGLRRWGRPQRGRERSLRGRPSHRHGASIPIRTELAVNLDDRHLDIVADLES